MTYSFIPLEEESLAIFIFLVLSVLLIDAIIFLVMCGYKSEPKFINSISVPATIIFMTLGIFFISEQRKPIKNEIVTGTFVGYVAEGYSEQTGKYRADRHKSYVVYRVGDSTVMLESNIGHSYPKEAILYRN